MLRSRIIPCLLIQKGGLVKTRQFTKPKYIGDPINAVRIFNEKKADELMIFDIDASAEQRGPNFELVSKLAAECQMPLCYGGGITNVEQAVQLVDMGVEKVAVSSAVIAQPALVSEIAAEVGRQSVVVVLDIKKKRGLFSESYSVYTLNGSKLCKKNPLELAKSLEDAGAGEIVINSIDNDGMMAGYDLKLANVFAEQSQIPITILGGAGKLCHLEELISTIGIVGAAAGSLFVFKGKYRAVLISYPSIDFKLNMPTSTN